ncbi:hypothetical protein GCM10010517_35250 [Streptosporangium fragile]|uniref:Uncharacterized protein n=1 Tax=Streptosporangium fragile TaxID=46186 RepID=A0ABP6IE27_9ACTN
MPRLSPGDLHRIAAPGDPWPRPGGSAGAHAATTTGRRPDPGENGGRCPAGQAGRRFAAPRERSAPIRPVRRPGGPHLFIRNGRPSHRAGHNERTTQWLEQWIPVDGTSGSAS